MDNSVAKLKHDDTRHEVRRWLRASCMSAYHGLLSLRIQPCTPETGYQPKRERIGDNYHSAFVGRTSAYGCLTKDWAGKTYKALASPV